MFANGAAFVDLAPLADPSLVSVTIAQALGVPTRDDPAEALARVLRPREFLLVLDNAEHLRDAAPGYAQLLAHAPRLTLLVTSRAVLHVSGEHVYPGRSRAVHLVVGHHGLAGRSGCGCHGSQLKQPVTLTRCDR
jgi:predicted ATPase